MLAKYFENFRWLPFLLQAGQVSKSLTGYGIVLGGVMGAVADTVWGLIRLGGGGSIRVEGPPPADPLGKAIRYISQPAYHAYHSAVLTFEEHMMLAAADFVAIQIIAAAASPAELDEKYVPFSQSRVVDFEPWHPDTIEGLRRVGYVRGSALGEPLPGLTGGATYEQSWQAIAAHQEQWWINVASEFPRAAVSTYFAYLTSEGGRMVFDWLNGSVGSVQPVFDPEEYALARMFETGVFPGSFPEPDLVGEFWTRAVEISSASGSPIPNRADILLAMQEVFGGSKQL